MSMTFLFIAGLWNSIASLQKISEMEELFRLMRLTDMVLFTAVSKMAFGNQMGVCLESSLDKDAIFAPAFGDIVAEVKADTFEELVGEYTLIGEVTK